MQFSHLHNHTQYSLLDGASSITNLYQKARHDHMPAIAITDHGNMFGVFDFVATAWKEKKQVGTTEDGKPIEEPVVKPIVGCEFYMVETRHKKEFKKASGEKDKRYHQLLLAKNEEGYRNLVKLCSIGYLEGMYSKYPRIDKEVLLQHHKGLIATTCCLGAEVPQAILKGGEAEGEKVFKWWLDLFGEDYFVEMQRHGIPEQNKVNEVLVKLARKYKVPIIASNDSHYVDVEDYNAHDILLCINTGEKQATPSMKEFSDDDENRPRNARFAFFNDQFFFKTTDEMSNLFGDLPEAIDNTGMIVDRIKPLKLERDIMLPHYEVPSGYDMDSYLEHLTWQGAHKRYNEMTPEIEERIKFELFTIRTMGFAGYFLIVQDFINHGKDIGVFVGPGRGSAAGSVVAFCIGITNIDPIKYKLLFERFLNPERKSMPDIDTDFDDAGRQKVIDYVVAKYGKKQVAQIVTYGTMAAKSSIKDVARVMDLPLAESTALAKLVTDKPGINVQLDRLLHAPLRGEGSLEQKEQLGGDDINNAELLRAVFKEDSMRAKVLKEALKLQGTVRGTGVHAAGIIIAPEDITNLLPVATAKDSDLLLTQYGGNVIENAGVIKMDFLGLKTLTILKDALALIKRNYNVEIDLDTLPLDDAKTFELYQRGDTNGTFQFESAGMQKHLRELKPTVFEDLVAMNALYRPGPIAYIPQFVRRKNGQEPIEYDLPEMQEYLEETYGVTVYQEQVMLLSQKLAGFSKGDADVLRKAMGKKQREVLDKMKSKFIDGAKAKGFEVKKLEKIWTDWEAFAQYAFNKSHSVCYALVAYQTAYLKAHYPAEYMAAVLNNQANIEKIKFHMGECQRMNIPVLGPDVNLSISGFSVDKNPAADEGEIFPIRFGMGAVKGAGEAAVEEIIQERERDGPFKNLTDFFCRIDHRKVNKKTLEMLVKAGALDSFKEVHRAQFFHTAEGEKMTALEKLFAFGQQFRAGQEQAVNSLFGAVSLTPEVKAPAIAPCEKWELAKQLEEEKEVVGIYLSAHPLDPFRFEMEKLGFLPIADVKAEKGPPFKMAGFLSDVGHLYTKKGAQFGKAILNDYTGSLEIVLFSDDYVRYHKFLNNGQKVVLTACYQERQWGDGEIELKVKNISLLENARDTSIKALNIGLPVKQMDTRLTDFLMENCEANPGNAELVLHLMDPGSGLHLKMKTGARKIAVNDDLISFLNKEKIAFGLELVR